MVFVCKYINVELVLEYSESIDIKDSFVVSRKVSSSTKKNDQTADFRLSNFQNDDPHFSFGNGYQHDMDMEERPVGSFGAHLGFVGSFSIRSNMFKNTYQKFLWSIVFISLKGNQQTVRTQTKDTNLLFQVNHRITMVDSKSKLPPRHPKSSSLPPSGKKKTKKVKDVSTDVKNDMDHSPIAKTPIKRRKRKNHVKDKKNTTHNSIQNGPFQEKANAILELLQQPEIDLWKLREECFTNGGLINGTSFYVYIAIAYGSYI